MRRCTEKKAKVHLHLDEAGRTRPVDFFDCCAGPIASLAEICLVVDIFYIKQLITRG